MSDKDKYDKLLEGLKDQPPCHPKSTHECYLAICEEIERLREYISHVEDQMNGYEV